MQWKSYCVYPTEIIQTSSLGRLQKKLLEDNDCLYVASVSQQESGTPQQTMSLVLKVTFKQIVKVLFQCFLKALEQHWDNLFECNFADL